MALLNAKLQREADPILCPRCKHELIVIDGNLVKWLNCTNCNWKKLAGKPREEVRITNMRDPAQAAPDQPQKLKVSFDRTK
jgi:hypothetical protein